MSLQDGDSPARVHERRWRCAAVSIRILADARWLLLKCKSKTAENSIWICSNGELYNEVYVSLSFPWIWENVSLHSAPFPGLSRPLCFLTTYCLSSGLLTCFYNELRARVSVGWTVFFFFIFFCTDLSLRYQKFDTLLLLSYKKDDNIIHQAFNPVLGIVLCPLNILSYFIYLIRRWQGEKKCTSSKRGFNIFGDRIFPLVKVIGDIEWGV